MATVVFGGALSHSPMMNLPFASNHDQVDRFRTATQEMGRLLRQAQPDVVVILGPDHFRTLFYDLMPAFTLGVDRVQGWGDWNTPVGPFNTDPALAQHILNCLMREGMEPAFSQEIKVDHGITQPLQLMNIEELPIVPVIINSAAPPLPAPSRCHALGAAI